MKSDKLINVTFSIPMEVNNLLHSLVERRGLSRFVTQALENALQEKKNSLRQAYADAENDQDRLTTIEEWQTLDTEKWNE